MEMNPQHPLNPLAECYGIQQEYVDIWGERHQVTQQTTQALLKAMGIHADDETQQREALSAYETRAWSRLLPPVQVEREGDGPFRIPVTMAEATEAQNMRWQLVMEDGERHEGSFIPRELEGVEHQRANGNAMVRYSFVLPLTPPCGYHRLELFGGEHHWTSMALIVTPASCYVPSVLAEDERVWGITAQLYGIRSMRNWGMGDFTDLRLLIDCCGEAGADFAGLNPLHALFLHNPSHCAPYAPSSRVFINALYLDIEAIPEFSESAKVHETVRAPEFQQRLQHAREGDQVDYAAISTLKLPVLAALYRSFRENHLEPNTDRGEAFRSYQAEGGALLNLYGLFEALHEHFNGDATSTQDWNNWPQEYQDPTSAAVESFAIAHQERIEFYQYLQWQAEVQLATAGARCLDHHLGVGLYLDLAVGTDRAGLDVWSNQEVYTTQATIGAPPDDFNLKGQNWGLSPPIPEQLKESAYAPFIHVLRQNMKHAGALRTDHVMALMRLFWIPDGHSPTQGAYVHYPFEDLLGILALESQRNHCFIIGEDVGTVPDAVRQALRSFSIASQRLLYFERQADGQFQPPADYPATAVVAVSTQDLPTLRGYWEGNDIVERTRLELFPTEELREQQVRNRVLDRSRLLKALDDEGVRPESVDLDPASTPEMTPELSRAVHLYMARTPAQMLAVQLEDILTLSEQANMPGTSEGYPNWQRKLPMLLEEICQNERFQALSSVLSLERSSSQDRVSSRRMDPSTQVTIPRATYRMQFNANFTFQQACALVPYLEELGVSHCYASPYLKARAGSLHGYDVIDHNSLNPEIGSDEDFEHYVTTLREHRMGQILDIVPNHMGVMGGDNGWWLDVLESGPASYYADFFDIDWEPVKKELYHKLLLPVLGEHYGNVLESGQLQLVFNPERGSFAVQYYEHVFPIDPKEYPRVLNYHSEQLELRLGANDPMLTEFQSLVSAFGHLPARTETDVTKLAERNRDKEIHKQRLATFCKTYPHFGEFIQENLNDFNPNGNNPQSAHRLHELLEVQAYRLAHWRVASDEINYRRFFDINDLAALRMDDEEVFRATHRFILQLVSDRRIDGLRIDHPDGLYDPFEYYRRLHMRSSTTGSGAASPTTPSIYIVAEKILAPFEQLREKWPIHGTSGYEFTNLVNGLFIEREAQEKVLNIYNGFVGGAMDFDEILYSCKKLIINTSLSSDLNMLANRLNRISETDPKTRDFTLNGLRHALMEIVACFPVYRTYISHEGVSEEDRKYIEWAVTLAKKRSPNMEKSLYDFIQDILLLSAGKGKDEGYHKAVIDFTMRFQQYTAPVTAKGLEDTALYGYNALTSLNEVGGHPSRFGISLSTFHQANQKRQRLWPHTLLCSSTHDTKRSEDVRARLNILSEIPDEWEAHLTRWTRLNQDFKKHLENGIWSPASNDEYLLYQTLLGAWPEGPIDEDGLSAFRERVQAYMTKATREAKVHTSWHYPNPKYEEGISSFLDNLLETNRKNRFLEDFVPFQRRIATLGMFNSLSQTLVKLTAPGVPDIYRGSELWDFSLVDPDNRRPVDYELRKQLLRDMATTDDTSDESLLEQANHLLGHMEDGRIKLYTIWKTLSLRKSSPDVFRLGNYIALTAHGEDAKCLCSFARRHAERDVIVIVPIRVASLVNGQETPPLGAVWKDTSLELSPSLARQNYYNLFTGEVITPQADGDSHYLAISSALMHFPVALLTNANPSV